jgi:hypothetical protein
VRDIEDGEGRKQKHYPSLGGWYSVLKIRVISADGT